jgi:hypothetical protein
MEEEREREREREIVCGSTLHGQRVFPPTECVQGLLLGRLSGEKQLADHGCWEMRWTLSLARLLVNLADLGDKKKWKVASAPTNLTHSSLG